MSSLKNDLNEKQYWRSLSDLADTEEFQSYVSKEFADVQVGEEGSVSRRRFMQLMGASLTLAGTPGCWWEGNGFWKKEKILPHVRRPQGWAPGTTKQYATAMEMDGVAQLLRIDSADGRPIKVEGNPEDSAGRGASNAYAQGSVLGLYDPDRSKKPAQRSRVPSATLRSTRSTKLSLRQPQTSLTALAWQSSLSHLAHLASHDSKPSSWRSIRKQPG